MFHGLGSQLLYLLDHQHVVVTEHVADRVASIGLQYEPDHKDYPRLAQSDSVNFKHCAFSGEAICNVSGGWFVGME